MATLTTQQLTLLKRDIWFGSLDPQWQDALLRIAVLRELESKQPLYLRGDPPTGLFAVLAGRLRLSGITASGDEAVVALLEPPIWFGEVSMADRLPHTHHVIAEVPSVVLQLPRIELEALLAQSPGHWRDIAILMALKTRLIFLNLEDLALLPPDTRLARRLVWLVQSADPNREQAICRLTLSQAALAELVFMSRQTANRALMQLQEQGALRVSHGAIAVLDRDALADAARLSMTDRAMLTQLYESQRVNPRDQT